ncbi:MAG: tetratricopeptide repeat protein [Acidobacteria bacterium]|nr:tetratricopeptide repeat protein [Acidobacteriota bacterium]
MLKRVTNIALAATLLLLVTGAAIPAPQEAVEKRPKDQKEFDLITAFYKETTDAAKKLQLLAEWEKSYPETAYGNERVQAFMLAHQQAGHPKETVEFAKKYLVLAPGDLQANIAITSMTTALYPAAGDAEKPQILKDGEKAASALLGASKPAQVSAEQWTSAKSQIDLTAHQTLGWIAMQRQDHPKAEEHFRKVLEMNPKLAQVSYWLGTELIAQGDAEKNEVALFSLARAVAYEGEGALAPEGRQQVAEYLTKVYSTYAGTTEGLDDLKMMAKTRPLPPADLEIKSSSVRKFEELQKSRADNPQLWAFLDLKKALQGAQGDTVWADLKGKVTPKMKLYVVSAAARSKTISLSSEEGGAVEVVLDLANMMRSGVGAGRQITFDGVAAALTKEPFKLTLTDGEVPALGISR